MYRDNIVIKVADATVICAMISITLHLRLQAVLYDDVALFVSAL
jgi:hypothetical protein